MLFKTREKAHRPNDRNFRLKRCFVVVHVHEGCARGALRLMAAQRSDQSFGQIVSRLLSGVAAQVVHCEYAAYFQSHLEYREILHRQKDPQQNLDFKEAQIKILHR